MLYLLVNSYVCDEEESKNVVLSAVNKVFELNQGRFVSGDVRILLSIFPVVNIIILLLFLVDRPSSKV